MTAQTLRDRCPDDRMKTLLAGKGGKQLAELDDALRDWPDDPRLHFLKGSLLAGRQDYTGARLAMRRAIDLAPDFRLARFQLGLLLLTSAEPIAAQEVWGPLQTLPPDHYLRIFADGLCRLIRDDFAGAADTLRSGLSRNNEIPAMNRDMQLVIDEISRKLDEGTVGQPQSSVDLLLQQAALKANRP